MSGHDMGGSYEETRRAMTPEERIEREACGTQLPPGATVPVDPAAGKPKVAWPPDGCE